MPLPKSLPERSEPEGGAGAGPAPEPPTAPCPMTYLAYISDMLRSMLGLAVVRERRFLAYLLGMAAEEAAREARRLRENGAASASVTRD